MIFNKGNFKELEDKTFIKIEKEDDEILFYLTDKVYYKMYHEQDCCESVWVEDVVGDLNDLIDSRIFQAEEVTEEGEKDYGTYTWTFYKIRSFDADITIRWNGESNGYYSESVDFALVIEDD